MITVHELYTALSQCDREALVTVKRGAIYVGDEALTEEDADEAVTTVLQREADTAIAVAGAEATAQGGA